MEVFAEQPLALPRCVNKLDVGQNTIKSIMYSIILQESFKNQVLLFMQLGGIGVTSVFFHMDSHIDPFRTVMFVEHFSR